MLKTLASSPENSPNLPAALEEKHEAIQRWLGGLGSAITAFSAGVDSTLVAVMAHQALGSRALAVTSGSESLKREELELAKTLARRWGLAHRVIVTQEMALPAYRANPADRCYFCKTTLYADLQRLAKAEGYAAVLNGTNADDLGDYRPGLKAAGEHEVLAPLAMFGVTKAEVRALALHLGLPNHDKPQSACLSSRVPYGLAISPEVLRRIEQAESLLKSLGFSQLRVRHHDALARIEVPVEDLPRVVAQREAIESGLRALGYRYVTLDLGGFRSGSMNEVLPGRG